MSFIKRKNRVRFTGTTLTESTEYLGNPSCGWYRIYPFPLGQKPDFDELYWCLRKDESLVLVIIDIGAYREGPIPEEALDILSDILRFFTEHQKELILRVTYDREGRGMEREPDFLQTVEEHMGQLGPVVRQFAESIFLVQGLLVGSWGEMHDSKFLTENKLKKLSQAWRKALGEDIRMAVRTPLQWRMLHSKETDFACNRIGLFDDGMFGSPDNLGTYGDRQREEAGWLERWRREDEISLIGRIAEYIPYGGEAVGTADTGDLVRAVEEMKVTGVTYLNRTHDLKRLEQWKSGTWKEHGVWDGVNGLDYIGCHMGYRFAVRKAEMRQCGLYMEGEEQHGEIIVSEKRYGENLAGEKQRKGKKICLIVQIENTGFAALKEIVLFDLIFKAENKDSIHVVFSIDMCGVAPGGQITVPLKLPELKTEETYAVSLQMRRKKDQQILRFANEPVMEQVYLGSLANF